MDTGLTTIDEKDIEKHRATAQSLVTRFVVLQADGGRSGTGLAGTGRRFVSTVSTGALRRTREVELAKTIDSLAFSEPSAPLVQNATAVAAADLDTLLGHLKAHVYNPVYWTRTVETLRDVHGVSTIIEAGPGKVLTGLGKRIDRSLPTLPVDSPATLAAALEAVGVTAA